MELLLGCGRMRDKRIVTGLGPDWKELITLDHNPDVNPDVLFDLSTIGKIIGEPTRGKFGEAMLPFGDDKFDEIHAYEVLEHIGQQGDYKTFFAQFGEFWRILKPNGLLCATVPMWNNVWAWGDPSHTRIINDGTIVFLSQKCYQEQQGKTAMTDFRNIWTKDFDIHLTTEREGSYIFILRAVKP